MDGLLELQLAALVGTIARRGSEGGPCRPHATLFCISARLSDDAHMTCLAWLLANYAILYPLASAQSIGSGHYTSDVLQGDDATWLRFDDSHVFRVSQQAVLSDRPYLLFYSRVEGS